MRINHNLMAMNTHRQYAINNENVSKSVEKLSSGYRINRAADDAAGLAISEKMRAQIRGLNMASKNSQDAISLVQTAEGALQESHNILQRMRELAVQSASDTNETTIDRDALNKEFQQLLQEVDDTAEKTVFNDQGLINGKFASYMTDPNIITTVPPGPPYTLAHVDYMACVAKGGVVLGANPNTVMAVGVDAVTGEATITINGGTPNEEKHILINGQTRLQLDNGISIEFAKAMDTSTPATITSSLNAIFGTTAGNVTITPTVAATNIDFVVQTGANKGDELHINIDKMDSKTLGIFGAHIATRLESSNAIKTVDTAIKTVSTQRAALGALQNRLEHKIANLDTSAENLQAAEARIRDLDMAKEMTVFTKNNILSQASNAMLAQANSLPQGVLQLLQ